MLFRSNAANKKIDLINNVPADNYCFADTYMANAIIRNLISNSIKFTGEGGRVTISSDLSDDGKYRIISVNDNGIGMAEDTLNRLFRIDANFTNLGTANEKGTGLGLVLCREFVDLHGGRIWAESENGKGSTFYFTLPVDQKMIKLKSPN